MIFLMHILEAGMEMSSHTKAMEWSEGSEKKRKRNIITFCACDG